MMQNFYIDQSRKPTMMLIFVVLKYYQNKVNKIGIDVTTTRAPVHLQEKLRKAHLKYSEVFEPDLSTGYNGYSGVNEVKLRFADENRPLMTKNTCTQVGWKTR